MVDYYQIIGVKPTATAAEIKSAYRRLARESHPDLNPESSEAARDFALIALAYRTLSDGQERARYDAQRERGAHRSTTVRWGSDSVFDSNNPHARRIRRMAAQRRWDRAVDRWIESERREAYAQTQAVFTTVTLFLSTFIVAVFKPRLWHSFDGVGRLVLVALFLVGLWHLFARLRASFKRYTYRPSKLQATVTTEEELPTKPFTRSKASLFLIIGYAISLAAGLFVGSQVHHILIFNDIPYLFGDKLRPDLLFYPPIAVLLVDTMHTVASKIDN